MTPDRDNVARRRLLTEAIQGSERLVLLEATLTHNRNLVKQRDSLVDRLCERERQVSCLLGLLAQAYPGEIKVEADMIPEDADREDAALQWPEPARAPPKLARSPQRQVDEDDPHAFERHLQETLKSVGLERVCAPDPAAYDRTIEE